MGQLPAVQARVRVAVEPPTLKSDAHHCHRDVQKMTWHPPLDHDWCRPTGDKLLEPFWPARQARQPSRFEIARGRLASKQEIALDPHPAAFAEPRGKRRLA